MKIKKIYEGNKLIATVSDDISEQEIARLYPGVFRVETIDVNKDRMQKMTFAQKLKEGVSKLGRGTTTVSKAISKGVVAVGKGTGKGIILVGKGAGKVINATGQAIESAEINRRKIAKSKTWETLSGLVSSKKKNVRKTSPKRRITRTKTKRKSSPKRRITRTTTKRKTSP